MTLTIAFDRNDVFECCVNLIYDVVEDNVEVARELSANDRDVDLVFLNIWCDGVPSLDQLHISDSGISTSGRTRNSRLVRTSSTAPMNDTCVSGSLRNSSFISEPLTITAHWSSIGTLKTLYYIASARSSAKSNKIQLMHKPWHIPLSRSQGHCESTYMPPSTKAEAGRGPCMVCDTAAGKIHLASRSLGDIIIRFSLPG